jgi:hypothetical protein
MRRTAGRLGVAAAIAVFASGCGGGLPLLHPARTLPRGEVRASGGFSGTVAVGSLSSAVRAAESDPNGGGVTGDTTYAKGALVVASVAPGLSPVVGARVGVGWESEGGLAYTGRAIRADMRRSFDLSEHWSLSIGVGGSAALYGDQSSGLYQGGSTLAGVSTNQLHGWGADVPLMVGYGSTGDIYMVWIGARAGGEHIDISDLTSEPKAVTLGSPPIGLSATRYWGGGLVGLAVGFRHLHVALELDASYATITGQYGGTQVTVAGVSLAPATALWWRF